MGDRGGGDAGRQTRQDARSFRTKAGQDQYAESVTGVAITPGAHNALTTPRSPLANIMRLSDASRQRNLNASYEIAHGTQREGNEDAHLAAVAREDARKKAEEEAAAEQTTATTTGTDTTAATTGTTTTAVDTAQTDYSKLLADMQTKYDAQLAAFQSEMDAATKQQADQLAKLTEATTKHKKKLKKSGRKYGRLSLLFGSELGIPKTTTLGG